MSSLVNIFILYKVWGAHLRDFTAVLESKLHIKYLELKIILLALKRFEPLYRDQTILVISDTVVSYINKEGNVRSGFLCALLSAHHISCYLKVVKTQTSDSDRVVSQLGGVRPDLSQVAPAPDRPFSHQVQ